MTDYTELKRLAEAATQGEWQVIETELPCRIGRPHVERRIFTAKNHPQLKAPYPVVNGSVALGTAEIPVHHMVSMTAEDAAFIAAANPAEVLALIAENEALHKRIADMSPFKGAPLTGQDTKCLACGGYHYGISGLPCPNMRVSAQADLPETRSGQIGAAMGKGERS